MSDVLVTGTIQTVERPSEDNKPIKVKLSKDSGGSKTITVWRTVKDSEGNDVSNPVLEALDLGLRGTFTGYENTWHSSALGKDITSFIAKDFKVSDQPAQEQTQNGHNGSVDVSKSFSSSQVDLNTKDLITNTNTYKLTPEERAIEKAAELFGHVVSTGGTLDPKNFPAEFHAIAAGIADAHYALLETQR